GAGTRWRAAAVATCGDRRHRPRRDLGAAARRCGRGGPHAPAGPRPRQRPGAGRTAGRPPQRHGRGAPVTRHWWIRVARTAWLLLLAVLVARVLIRHRDQLADLLTVDHPWLLAAALATSFGQLVLNAAFW